MPNSTPDEIRAQEIVTTNSEPLIFTVSINVDDAHIFDLNTSYQTLANVLSVHFQTWHGEDELVDPNDLSAEHYLCRVPGREFEDDEKWVPWPKKSKSPRRIPNSYTGRVPVVVRPAGEGRRRARGQLRAPFLDPVSTFPPQGEERIYRYYRPPVSENSGQVTLDLEMAFHTPC